MLGGVLVDTIGWRAVCAESIMVCLLVGTWTIPADALMQPPTLERLKPDIDCTGTIVATARLALLAYVLVIISTSASYVGNANVTAPLTVSLLLIPVFALWVGRHERLQRPALIPNSLWLSIPFTSICLMSFSHTPLCKL